MFPRGGQNKIIGYKKKRKQLTNFFNDKKRRKVDKTTEVSPIVEKWKASFIQPQALSYKTMQQGMVVLSCIRNISNMSLQLEFPGLTFGLVTINNLSDTLNEIISEDENYEDYIRQIFKIGQFMPAKILNISENDKGHEVQASVNPKDINSGKKHNSFKQGFVIWAYVISEQEYGYELSIGVDDCRVFLPFENAEKKYYKGQPIWCMIHKVQSSQFATTITVTAKEKDFEQVQNDNLTLDDVVPGMRVKFLIKQISPRGIKGEFFDNCLGFIDESQLLDKPSKNLQEGTNLHPYVLFVEPMTKVTLLTLKRPETATEIKHKVGQHTSARVFYHSPKGIYLQLQNHHYGFITNKRLLKTLPNLAQIDVSQSLRTKYPIGTVHECCILDYNHMQQLFICTFEKQVLNETVFGIGDLRVGQEVSVKVDKIVPHGLMVKCGNVLGFVPNIHIGNAKFSTKLKAKCEVGMTFKAKVWSTNDDKAVFTLKQTLIASKECLVKVEDALPNSKFVGIVLQTKQVGALIGFYGNIQGWISTKNLNKENPENYLDPRQYFYVGQVVTVWILGMKDNQLQLSLNRPSQIEIKPKLQIGELVKGKIVTVKPDELIVEVTKQKIQSVVPVEHLSLNEHLSSVFYKLCRPGDKITNLMCIKNTESLPVLSRREGNVYSKKFYKVLKLRDLKRGKILRCSFIESGNGGIYVSVALKDFRENVFIGSDNVGSNDVEAFYKYQPMLVKVLNVEYNKKEIQLSVISRNKGNKFETINSIVDVMEEMENVLKLHKHKNPTLSEYEIGTRVKCELGEVDTKGNYVVSLADGVNGTIPSHLQSSNCKPGSVIEGVILDYDFLNDVYVISAKSKINDNINAIQDGNFSNTNLNCTVKILLLTDLYAVGISVNTDINKQLVYFPLCFNEDKKSLCLKNFETVIFGKVGRYVLGVPKKFFNFLKIDRIGDYAIKADEDSVNELEATSEENVQNQVNKKKKKRKVEEETHSEEPKIVQIEGSNEKKKKRKVEEETNSEEIVQIEKGLNEKKKKRKVEEEPTQNGKKKTRKIEQETCSNESEIEAADKVEIVQECPIPILPGADSFFVTQTDQLKSSSESEMETEQPIRKKKNLSASERAELAKKEEERIAHIEKALLDKSRVPESAEEFDRRVLSNPNSSALWLQYMSMHLATAEFDKARAVGKRATETINMTLHKEKFNIWVALLNLENMYGTKESFEVCFSEAVKYNDALDIYLSACKILAKSGKFQEMEEKVKKLKSIEKQNSKMWLEIGRLYYTIGQFTEARKLKEAALRSISFKKMQYDIIIRFALMEFQMGELEQAIAQFETILAVYPAQINVWIQYVDQLIKRNQIESAREVLERGIGQKLGVKPMNTLFQKFINFEERYGTSENIQKIKQRAEGYLATLGVK